LTRLGFGHRVPATWHRRDGLEELIANRIYR
jgi:hypothetical protein